MPTIVITTPDIEKRTSKYDQYHGVALDDFLSKYNGEVKEATIKFFRYMAEKFRKPAKDDLKTYIITTAYCNVALMHADSKANAIYYPSVPFGGQGVNFAINKNFTDIELTHVLRSEFSITQTENGKHSFKETNARECKSIKIQENAIFG